jgi:hypothetical protein
MSDQRPLYPVDAWRIRELTFDPAYAARNETIFSLGNGHLGLLLEVAAQAQVPVGQREDRLVTRRIRWVEGQLPDSPGVDGVQGSLVGHQAQSG